MDKDIDMSFDQFSLGLVAHLHMQQVGSLQRDTLLVEDLRMDSLDAFQMLVWVEVVSDVPYPVVDPPVMETLGDAYDYYAALRSGVGDA